jgi:hypothetical protein
VVYSSAASIAVVEIPVTSISSHICQPVLRSTGSSCRSLKTVNSIRDYFSKMRPKARGEELLAVCGLSTRMFTLSLILRTWPPSPAPFLNA